MMAEIKDALESAKIPYHERTITTSHHCPTGSHRSMRSSRAHAIIDTANAALEKAKRSFRIGATRQNG